ncbi:MAG: GNAT family N-acetyltransferase [Variibacter sp.]|nr:GNAT family N-acetyltransferase [Variibacter sp.]
MSDPLHVRPARPAEFPAIEALILASFEPVTWARPLDERFGPLNGLDWRARWRLRLEKVFAEQIVLAGEDAEGVAAVATCTLDPRTALAYIDILAVDPGRQRKGLGRAMLRGAMDHLRSLGARYVNLDCLTTNGKANDLYRSEGFEEAACHIRWFRAL